MKKNYKKRYLISLLFCVFFLSSCITSSVDTRVLEDKDSSLTSQSKVEIKKSDKKYKKLIKKFLMKLLKFKKKKII